MGMNGFTSLRGVGLDCGVCSIDGDAVGVEREADASGRDQVFPKERGGKQWRNVNVSVFRVNRPAHQVFIFSTMHQKTRKNKEYGRYVSVNRDKGSWFSATNGADLGIETGSQTSQETTARGSLAKAVRPIPTL